MTTAQRALQLSDLLGESADAPLVMGIVNVTPDSFSDGGVHLDPEVAVKAALQMERDGASIIDIGGESTRPGALPVALDSELQRVIPVIEAIRRKSRIAISIDTSKAEVAAAALDAGADLINDVSALQNDPAMLPLLVARGCPVILMHMRGEPRTMQQSVHYDDLLGEIRNALISWMGMAVAAGVGRGQLLIDPGIGFGKDAEHNLELLRRCGELRDLAPVVIGASRKAFIGQITGREGGPARMPGSLAAVSAAHTAGAAIVRVHDVAASVDFLKVARAIAQKDK